MEQLSLFGASQDQNTFMSASWGLLTFFPTKKFSEKDCCRKCLLWNGGTMDECSFAPCKPLTRADKKAGFYSIRQFPQR